jgi:hypothetical protein
MRENRATSIDKFNQKEKISRRDRYYIDLLKLKFKKRILLKSIKDSFYYCINFIALRKQQAMFVCYRI